MSSPSCTKTHKPFQCHQQFLNEYTKLHQVAPAIQCHQHFLEVQLMKQPCKLSSVTNICQSTRSAPSCSKLHQAPTVSQSTVQAVQALKNNETTLSPTFSQRQRTRSTVHCMGVMWTLSSDTKVLSTHNVLNDFSNISNMAEVDFCFLNLCLLEFWLSLTCPKEKQYWEKARFAIMHQSSVH